MDMSPLVQGAKDLVADLEKIDPHNLDEDDIKTALDQAQGLANELNGLWHEAYEAAHGERGGTMTVWQPGERCPEKGEIITFRLIDNSVVGTAKVLGVRDNCVVYQFSGGHVGNHAVGSFGPWRLATDDERRRWSDNVPFL